MLNGRNFDGKRMRKAVHRKTVDYNSPLIHCIEVFILILMLLLFF